MKIAQLFICFLSCFLILNCGNSATSKRAPDNSTEGPSAATTAVNDQSSGLNEGIVGYWKLALEAYDENRNGKLDDDERKKGIQNRYSFRFHADGSCQIMDLFKGRYERKKENGKDVLMVYRNRIPEEEKMDPPPDGYIITALGNNEMVLLETIGNNTFWVFKKQ